MRHLWTAEQFFRTTSWYRFGPSSPKRQAHELIRRLLEENERLRLALGAAPEAARPTWVQRVG